LLDLDRPITADLITEGKIEILTREAEDALEVIRHDTAHVLAQAVQELFPGTQVTIGPNVENGFYYDFARDEPFSLDDLPKIEARMRQIVERDEPIRREVVDRDDAIADFEAMGEAYKAEIIRGLPEGETVTVYHQGTGWKDLCRSPEVDESKGKRARRNHGE
jgi:threonyl-tRNA synthetase